MTAEQLARLAQVALDDLARIRGGIDQARLVLSDTDDALEQSRQSLAALRDTLRGG